MCKIRAKNRKSNYERNSLKFYVMAVHFTVNLKINRKKAIDIDICSGVIALKTSIMS